LVNQYALGNFQQALETYPGLPHRQEIVGRHKHILAINDSKATNLEAAAKSLASFDHIYWILGGRMKEGGEDLSSVLPYFPKIRKAYTIGESSAVYSKLLKPHLPVEKLTTLEEAVQHAMKDATQDGHKATVLLAPACASWDQFKNFEHRGQVFKSLVLDWVKNHVA
jgi:UDP-N-acetylmuramoylalanine--D-glutamate ligase